MGKARKKSRTHLKPDESVAKSTPKSFILKSGKNFPASSMLLLKDLRKVMLPNTSQKLQQKRGNKLKDFLHVAGQLAVTHTLILSKTNSGTNLRIAKLPRGPTMSFKITQYSLVKDVLASQRRTRLPSAYSYTTSPLLVLNNFKSAEKHVKLLSVMLQNMFPSISVQTMKLAEVQRVVLFSYNEDGTISLRHYLVHIKKCMTGNKNIKKVLKTRGNVDISSYKDISDFISASGYASETDAEDAYLSGEEEKQEKRAIRLHEIGPRLTLKLLKIQDGFCDGQVIYHDYMQKTKAEEKELNLKKQEERKLKEERCKTQEENVRRKKEQKEKENKNEAELQDDDEMDEDPMSDFDDGDEFDLKDFYQSGQEDSDEEEQ